MTPDDPRHGTRPGALAHHRDGEKPCDPCREAKNAYERRRYKTPGAGWVDAAPYRRHVHRLIRHGMLWQDIARASGLSHDCVKLLDEGASRYILPSTAEKIARVPPPKELDPRHTRRGPVGSRRRLQALIAIGHPQRALAAELGWREPVLSDFLHGRKSNTFVRVDTHHTIAHMYHRLSLKPGGSVRSINRAKRHGWAPPFAWDNIDDPNETPKGIPDWRSHRRDPHIVDRGAVERRMAGDRTVRLNKAETTVMVRQMMDDGYTYAAIRTITGITVDKRRDGTQKRAAA